MSTNFCIHASLAKGTSLKKSFNASSAAMYFWNSKLNWNFLTDPSSTVNEFWADAELTIRRYCIHILILNYDFREQKELLRIHNIDQISIEQKEAILTHIGKVRSAWPVLEINIEKLLSSGPQYLPPHFPENKKNPGSNQFRHSTG